MGANRLMGNTCSGLSTTDPISANETLCIKRQHRDKRHTMHKIRILINPSVGRLSCCCPTSVHFTLPPCVRGMRIRVNDILEMLVEGVSMDEVLADLPDLDAY